MTFEADEHLRKGDIGCEASLVEGPEKVEPARVADATLLIREDGRERTVTLDGATTTRSDACRSAR